MLNYFHFLMVPGRSTWFSTLKNKILNTNSLKGFLFVFTDYNFYKDQ